MKKENKIMAKQRRAAERKKKEQQEMIKKICAIGIPVIIILIIIILCIVDTTYDKASYTDNEEGTSVETTLDTAADDPAYLTDTSLTVEDGDTVNNDYVGYIDGVAFEGGDTKGNGTDLTIGSGKYIDDFEEQLIGAHPGETVEVNVTFPENYGNEDLNGKDALFEVVINGIYGEE